MNQEKEEVFQRSSPAELAAGVKSPAQERAELLHEVRKAVYMIQAQEVQGYSYVSELSQIHREFLTASQEGRWQKFHDYFTVCERNWGLIRQAPMRVKCKARAKRQNLRQRLMKLEPKAWFTIESNAWKAFLWEELAKFLPENSPAEIGPDYVKAFVKVVGRTYERAMTNLLKYEYQVIRPNNVLVVSLDQPLREEDNAETLGDILPDDRPLVNDSGLCTVIQHELDAWIDERAARRPHRRDQYRRIANAWARRYVCKEQIREMWKDGGLGKNEDHFRDCLNQITDRIRDRLLREGYGPSPGVRHEEAA